MSSPFAGGELDTDSGDPQLIDLAVTSDGLPSHVRIVGGSPELADETRGRLLELQSLWHDEDADNGLAKLNTTTGASIPVAAETLLLLGLAEQVLSEWGQSADQRYATNTGGIDRDAPKTTTASDSLDLSTELEPLCSASGSQPPTLSFAAMTVSLGAPLPDAVVGWLQSWANALTVDLLLADLIEARVWGASVRVGGVMRTFGINSCGGAWSHTVSTPDGRTRALDVGDGALASSTAAAVGRTLRLAPATWDEPDTIVWAAAQSAMAWQAQVAADSLIGLSEAAALARLAQTGQRALLYRHDRQLREIAQV